MLPPWPIVNSPEWLISPDCHQKMGGAAAPTPHPLPLCVPLMHGRHSILNCGKDTLWARCSQGSRELAPWLQGDSTPLLKKILYLVGTWYIMIRNFITHFRLKLLSRAHTHTKSLRKTWLGTYKPLLRTKKTKKKLTTPPSAYQKSHDPPHILPPPVELMDGPLRHSDWRVM